MKIFVDWPWSYDVRTYGAPCRIYVHRKRWMYMIGLMPWIKGQVWTKKEGYTERFGWIVRHPKDEEKGP